MLHVLAETQELAEDMRGCTLLITLQGDARSQNAVSAAKNAGISLVTLQKDPRRPGLFTAAGWQQQVRATCADD